MADQTKDPTSGLEAEPGDAATPDRKVTGDASAPAAAATDTLNDLQVSEADARRRQADRAGQDDRDGDDRREGDLA